MRFKKRLQQPGARRTTAWHHHGSDRPTSARAVLHHKDPNGPNILKGSVCTQIMDYEKTHQEKKFLRAQKRKKEKSYHLQAHCSNSIQSHALFPLFLESSFSILEN